MTHHVLLLTTRRIILLHLHLSQQLKIDMPCLLRPPGPKCIGIRRECVLYRGCPLDRHMRLMLLHVTKSATLHVLRQWLRFSAFYSAVCVCVCVCARARV